VDLEGVRTFVKVAELGSFTRAAHHLGVSKSRASLRVRGLEAELGTRLLQRTTRAVRPTPDGEGFLERARRLVSDADDVAGMFQAGRALRGTLRVDLPITFARQVVIPRLPEFLSAHPLLALQLGTTDRRVDVVREGFDCVLRIGALEDSGLVARRLGVLPMVNCASPGYLERYGTPRDLADLDRHVLVHYSGRFGADAPGFEYRDGDRHRERPMRAIVTVNAADAFLAAALAGLGIVQAPRVGMAANLSAGTLVEVLPALTCAPMPVSIVHAYAGTVPRRVRLFMTWLAEILAPHLARREGP
jgi:DNA-binding transcriptional LysR family regulator